jgi:mRNA interferase RelE/StbE
LSSSGASGDLGPPYEIFWSSPGKRLLRRVPEKIALAAIEFAHSRLRENPHRMGKPLGLELEGSHSARLGDFRIVYEIDEPRHRVIVLTVEHRSDVYRRR